MENLAQRCVTRWWFWLLGAGALLAVTGAKFRLIQIFGSDIPFSDQWYGEVTTTYAPYLDGHFGWRSWLTPHFEHRIAWTRLLDVGLLEANGHWDPRLQLIADSLILLAAVALLIRHVTRELPTLLASAGVGCLALFFGSEVLWENTLSGFQSQFYFLLFFSLVHVLETSTARPWSTAWWLGQAAGLANLFAMAGGPISAAALLVWLAWRRWRCGERAPGDPFVAVWNLSLLLLSLLLLPAGGIGRHGPAHPGWGEILHRLCDVLSWPALDWRLGLLVGGPALLFLGRCLVAPARRSGPTWLFPLILLSLGFGASVTFARGGALASRYSDFYCVGVLANLVCLLTWPAPARLARLRIVLLWLWTSLMIHWLWRDEQLAFVHTLQKDLVTREREGECIRHFLRTGDAQLLRGDVFFDSTQVAALETIRDQPRLQAILPVSLQVPHAIVPAPEQTDRGFSQDQLPVRSGLPSGCPAWGSFGKTGAEARWTSAPLTARLPFLVFRVTGEIRPPVSELKLVTAAGRTVRPLQREVHATDKWVRMNFPNPGEPFRIVASDSNPGAAFAFSAPVESGRWSWLVPKVLNNWNVLRVSGWILLAAAALVPLSGIRASAPPAPPPAPPDELPPVSSP